jgi:hypothetical protein
MCTAVINLTSKSLNDVTDAEALIKIKTIIALFIQTMEVRYRQSSIPGEGLIRW